jgi:hypothetical protein
MKKIILLLLLTQVKINAQEYQPFKGQVVDLVTREPIAGVNIRVGKIGTATNEKGHFLLKIPNKLIGSTITASFIGYNNYTQKHTLSDTSINILPLELSSIELNEVSVYSNANAIVKIAFENISENYAISPVILDGFYREVSQNPVTLQYNYLAEAMEKIYKPSYLSSSEESSVHILQSRKKEFIPLDSMQMFFTSGTFAPITFDGVHERIDFINPKNFDDFEYILQDLTTVDNEDIYVISFAPKSEKKLGCKGTLYITTQNKAIVGIDYSPNHALLAKTSKKSIKGATFHSKETKIRYQKLEGKYYLQSIAHEMIMDRVNKKGKVEDLKLNIEFTTTNIELDNVLKPSEIAKTNRSDIFLKVVGSMDEDFWKNYTTVLQNIPLEEQLSKLSKETFHK